MRKEFELYYSKKEDVFANAIRITEEDFKSFKNCIPSIRLHNIIRITNLDSDKKIKPRAFVQLRTILKDDVLYDTEENVARIDQDTRIKLVIDEEAFEESFEKRESFVMNFGIQESSIRGLFLYCITHSNPIVKYPAWIAYLIGMLALIVSITSLFLPEFLDLHLYMTIIIIIVCFYFISVIPYAYCRKCIK
ncbi:MAG: hypothetical protein ACXAAM_08620 [Candidatus Heimdallarchaeaceae archaeon]